MEDLLQPQDNLTVIKVDNQLVLCMAKNSINHGQTKHIQVKYHIIKQVQKEDDSCLTHCRSNDQLVDILIKSGKRKVRGTKG